MFSGKTEEMIRRVRRAMIAKQQVQVFKPQIDGRYGVGYVSTHYGEKIEAISVQGSSFIYDRLNENTTVVAIDEVQFFDTGIVEVVEELADSGLRVILGGLDLDFRGEPFGPMPLLLARAEDVLKLRAICIVCGGEASRTQRLVDGQPAYYDDPIILVGAQESYEARCRHDHKVPRREPTSVASP